MTAPGYFPPPLSTPRGGPRGGPASGLCIAKQNSRAQAILRLRFGPALRCGCRTAPPAACRRLAKAAMGAADPTEGQTR